MGLDDIVFLTLVGLFMGLSLYGMKAVQTSEKKRASEETDQE